MCRPLMPMMKSYHGSMGISAFLFRRTWKPKAPWLPLGLGDGESESRRDMKRLSAPNIVSSRWLELRWMGGLCALSIRGWKHGLLINIAVTLRGHSFLALAEMATLITSE